MYNNCCFYNKQYNPEPKREKRKGVTNNRPSLYIRCYLLLIFMYRCIKEFNIIISLKNQYQFIVFNEKNHFEGSRFQVILKNS